MEICCRIPEWISKSEWNPPVHERNDGADFMEETCDSDCVFDSGGITYSSVVARFNELDGLFIADDARSTTSSTSSVEDWNEEEYGKELGEPIPQSYIRYLGEASDDELGLPPNSYEFGETLQPVDFDLDFDVDCHREDQSRFWLSLLRS